MQKKTLELIESARAVLAEYHPMTVRQVFYQLVSRLVLKNTEQQYKQLSRHLTTAREEGIIPDEWIEDRTRRPRDVPMWDGLDEFLSDARYWYRRNVWNTQPRYVVLWVEKDALSGIFEEITNEYGVTLVVGRGYNSHSIKAEMAKRFQSIEKPITILYFGDFDPSGENIYQNLKESFPRDFGISLEIKKVALRFEDIERYQLPPNPAKKTDSRAGSFIEKYGDISVELDALPLPVLQKRIRESIHHRMDMEALLQVAQVEAKEKARLVSMLKVSP